MSGSNQANVLKYLGLDYIFNGKNVNNVNREKILKTTLKNSGFKGYVFTTKGSYKIVHPGEDPIHIQYINLKQLHNMGNKNSTNKFMYANSGIEEKPTRLIELTHFCKLDDQPPEWNGSGLNKKLEDLYKKFVGEAVEEETAGNENATPQRAPGNATPQGGPRNGNGNGNGGTTPPVGQPEGQPEEAPAAAGGTEEPEVINGNGGAQPAQPAAGAPQQGAGVNMNNTNNENE